jgi:hypothetical protein
VKRIAVVLGLLVSLPASAELKAGRRTYHLNGIKMTLTTPRLVAQAGNGNVCWFPSLLQFSTGEVVFSHLLNGDVVGGEKDAQRLYLSRDLGRTFDRDNDFNVDGFWAGDEPWISLADGRIVGIGSLIKPEPPGSQFQYRMQRRTLQDHGRSYTVEPWGATLEGLPDEIIPYGVRTYHWWVNGLVLGRILVLKDGGWMMTIIAQYKKVGAWGLDTVVSYDEGRSWRWRAHVANAMDIPGPAEGPDEPALVRLANDSIMLITRVGNDLKMGRSFSFDEGSTWTKMDQVEVRSVDPQMLFATNGVLVVTSGRPNIDINFSVDGSVSLLRFGGHLLKGEDVHHAAKEAQTVLARVPG